MAEAAEATVVREYRYSMDPEGRTRFVKIALWVSLGMGILAIASDTLELDMLTTSFTREIARMNDIRQVAIGLVRLVALVVAAVAFFMWAHRACRNCHGFGATGMKFTPAWTVGCFLVPVVCFWWPYQAMKQIWLVSRDPAQWQSLQRTSLLPVWWFVVLVSGATSDVSFKAAMRAESIEEFRVAAQFSVMAGVTYVAATALTLALINSIASSQRRLVTASGPQSN